MSKVDYREILRLNSLQYSRNRIAGSVGSSHHTVKDVIEAAEEKHITWPLDEGVTDTGLEAILFPNKHRIESIYAEPDYVYIHRELARPGTNLTQLWEEYCRTCYENGKTPYMSTQFGEKYRKWAQITKATMRITHKPGDAMEVDWAGDTIPVFDPVTGEADVCIFSSPFCPAAAMCTRRPVMTWPVRTGSFVMSTPIATLEALPACSSRTTAGPLRSPKPAMRRS